MQAAVALPLFRYYGVAKANGIAFGFGLQAIEASVGVGVGLLFLAREGLSFAMLKVMPDVGQAELPEDGDDPGGSGGERCRARARSRLRLASKAFSPRARLRLRWRKDCASGRDVDELPVADGGEGTLDVLQPVLGAEWREADVHDAFGRPRTASWLWRGGDAYVEAAEVIPLDPQRLDPIAASSRGLGELIRAVGGTARLFVGLGGTANVDGGAGLLEVLDELPAPTQVACDVDVPLADAVRLFAAQKGATPEQLPLLEARLEPLAEYAELPGAGAAGGLGAAFASLGAELVPGPRSCSTTSASTRLATTSSSRARAPSTRRALVARRRGRSLRAARRQACAASSSEAASVEPLPGVETVALSGDPGRAREDLRELGLRLRGLDAAR